MSQDNIQVLVALRSAISMSVILHNEIKEVSERLAVLKPGGLSPVRSAEVVLSVAKLTMLNDLVRNHANDVLVQVASLNGLTREGLVQTVSDAQKSASEKSS